MGNGCCDSFSNQVYRYWNASVLLWFLAPINFVSSCEFRKLKGAIISAKKDHKSFFWSSHDLGYSNGIKSL